MNEERARKLIEKEIHYILAFTTGCNHCFLDDKTCESDGETSNCRKVMEAYYGVEAL
jgi:hypothetical protein